MRFTSQPPPQPPTDDTSSRNVIAYDHIVGNVRFMDNTVQRVRRMWPKNTLGELYEFASFTAAEVGTENSGLNSIVLRPSSVFLPGGEDEVAKTSGVLLPLNEPVDGAETKSQITTYLVHNKGEG